MNLKEAFRYQNFLQKLTDEISGILQSSLNATVVTETILCKKVNPEAENMEQTLEAPSEHAQYLPLMVELYMSLLSEKEKLGKAIHETKASLPMDLDTEVALNGKRQETRSVLMTMDSFRNGEVIRCGAGTGYRFNTDGNQVTYRCDVKRVTVINFDRRAVRAHIAELNRRIDTVSAEIDRCLINSEVNYLPPYDVNDTLTGVVETYREKL